MAVNELIKELDLNLQVDHYEIFEDKIILQVSSLLHEKPCPHCGLESSSIHAYYIHTFSDLPIQGKETIIKLKKRKFKCLNPDCKHVTFSDNYNFVDKKAKKTKRLLDEIIKASLTQSSISATKYLNSMGIQIKKSSICDYIKKNDTRNR